MRGRGPPQAGQTPDLHLPCHPHPQPHPTPPKVHPGADEARHQAQGHHDAHGEYNHDIALFMFRLDFDIVRHGRRPARRVAGARRAAAVRFYHRRLLTQSPRRLRTRSRASSRPAARPTRCGSLSRLLLLAFVFARAAVFGARRRCAGWLWQQGASRRWPVRLKAVAQGRHPPTPPHPLAPPPGPPLPGHRAHPLPSLCP